MLDNQIFYYHSLCSGRAKQMWIVLWYNRKHKVLLRTREFSTQGKLSESSLLILQQHIQICKLLIPLVPRGPNTTTAQPWLRLYSLQYTSEFLLPLMFFIVSPLHRGYYTMVRRYEFYFRVAKQYFTNERSKWVKYCFCQEKIK